MSQETLRTLELPQFIAHPRDIIHWYEDTDINDIATLLLMNIADVELYNSLVTILGSDVC